ncbi:MAG: IclR family transcriptional regulator [Caulobacteraceae bacterium]|nr:IclR family transcriptional regulator [Caulobacteraceae bacterium]
MTSPPSQTTVKSALRTLDLIEYIVAHPAGVGAQDISAALAIPVSSLSYLLATLTDRSYLARVGRRYYAGPGLDRLRRSREDHSLAERAQPLIRALRLQVNETSSLFEQDGWELVAAVTETAEHTLRYSITIGARTPLHCVAAGKALLAALSPEALDRYFAESRRDRFTDHTLTDRAGLMAEMSTIREAGYARAQDEYLMGISAVGAAIMSGGTPAAAISVAIPSSRFTPEAEAQVVEQVLRTKRALEDQDN